MGRPRRTTCRICDRHIDVVGPLSSRGRCEECGVAQVVESVYAMIGREGPMYDRYCRRLAEYGQTLVEQYGDGAS